MAETCDFSGWRASRAAVSCLIALASLAGAGAAGASPLDGNGMWIWYVSSSGGSAGAIAEKARSNGVRLVLIKSSDGASRWSQFDRALVRGLHRRGMTVCAWQFVYGNRPRDEARRGAEAVARGADCLVVDAEAHYEGRYAAADRYVRALRRRIGSSYPLALTSFPWVDYHPSLPYSVFLGRGGARLNVPQVYWRAIGSSVDATMKHTYRWNRPYDRPIYPLGQTWQDPPTAEIRRFRRLAKGYGARGVSWWSWQETGGREWNAVGDPIHPPYPDTPTRFPTLRPGAIGDVVVLLQELLRAAGERVEIDGTFGTRTANAVRSFREANGLDSRTVAGPAVWRALRSYRPVRVRWSRRGNPDHVRAAALRPRLGPALELRSSPGRP